MVLSSRDKYPLKGDSVTCRNYELRARVQQSALPNFQPCAFSSFAKIFSFGISRVRLIARRPKNSSPRETYRFQKRGGETRDSDPCPPKLIARSGFHGFLALIEDVGYRRATSVKYTRYRPGERVTIGGTHFRVTVNPKSSV